MNIVSFYSNIKVLNFDLISKFNIHKKNLLIKIKKIIILIKLKSNESDFLIKFLIFSKIIYFWLKQKITILFFKKDYIKGSRNSLIIFLGLNLKKIIFKNFLNYFINIIIKISKNLDNSLNLTIKNKNLIFKFSNLNYLLGLNINKYYKYNIDINVIMTFKNLINFNVLKIYEKIFF